MKHVPLCFALLLMPLLTYAETPLTLAGVQAEAVVAPLEYRLDGVVEASKQATLSAEVAGRIEAVYFDVDDTVKKGEIILKIRDNEYRAQLKRAQATLAEAMANLQDTKQEFTRNRDLRQQKLISQAAFDKAKANYNASQARLQSAEANVSEAEEQFDHTIVRAPFSGVVVERHAESGELISPGQKIMTGYDRSKLRVIANVPQSIIAGVRKHQQVRIVLLEDNATIPVNRITIHPFANAQNHSFTVRLSIPATTDTLFPGMLVKVVFTLGETSRLLIPRESLVYRSEVSAVYVIDETGKVSFRQVRPGNPVGERIEILAGLEANETVALDPVRAGIQLKNQLEAVR